MEFKLKNKQCYICKKIASYSYGYCSKCFVFCCGRHLIRTREGYLCARCKNN